MAATVRTLGNVAGASVRDWANDITGILQALCVAYNLSLAYSVGSNALTIAAKQQGGADASADIPIAVGMRSATAGSGDFNVRSITAALSLTVSSGSTLGHGNSDSRWTHVYLIDNAGAIELAVASKFFGVSGIVSTTAEGGAGGADSATTMYSTAARSNVAFICVGRFKAPQTTAGTWTATPTSTEVSGFADVTGPPSSTDNAVARFDSTTGDLIQNSGVIVDDSNNVTGVATLTLSGGQIAFPATQNASAGANTLDDYEEGTWSPVLTDDTNDATMSVQIGFYTKNGRSVDIETDVGTSSLGSVTGSLRIKTLPFTHLTSARAVLAAAQATGLAITAGMSVSGVILTDGIVITPNLWDAATGITALQASEWSDDGRMAFGGTYATT